MQRAAVTTGGALTLHHTATVTNLQSLWEPRSSIRTWSSVVLMKSWVCLQVTWQTAGEIYWSVCYIMCVCVCQASCYTSSLTLWAAWVWSSRLCWCRNMTWWSLTPSAPCWSPCSSESGDYYDYYCNTLHSSAPVNLKQFVNSWKRLDHFRHFIDSDLLISVWCDDAAQTSLNMTSCII